MKPYTVHLEGKDRNKNKCCHYSSALNSNGWDDVIYGFILVFSLSFFIRKRKNLIYSIWAVQQKVGSKLLPSISFHIFQIVNSVECAFHLIANSATHCTSVAKPFATNPLLTRLLTDSNRLAGLRAFVPCVRMVFYVFHSRTTLHMENSHTHNFSEWKCHRAFTFFTMS